MQTALADGTRTVAPPITAVRSVTRAPLRSTLGGRVRTEIRLSTVEEGTLLEAGLVGSEADVSRLVVYLMPVVQARVAQVLSTAAGGSRRRNLREEIEDLSQDVFTTLFDKDARILRAWSPNRGLSLRNFVGMVARRKANATLSVRKRNPWYEEPMDDAAVERALPEAAGAEEELAAKQVVREAIRRLEEEQTERGKRLLELIVKDGLSNAEVAEATGMSDSAVYQWRSRLTRALRKHVDELLAEGGTP